MEPIQHILDEQDGVFSRVQAAGAGLDATAVKRRLRRREWVAVHAGVYVSHTGPLTWRQRAWAAVLACWPECPADGEHDRGIGGQAG
ncbi:type IV toxin-antitoxin system AbiEi family antitoxin domain-containing protein [Nocardioides panacisoli]